MVDADVEKGAEKPILCRRGVLVDPNRGLRGNVLLEIGEKGQRILVRKPQDSEKTFPRTPADQR